MLPVVRRELQVAARRQATYRLRMLAAGSALALALVFVGLARISPANAGGALFRVMSWAAFVICLVEGLRVASDALARERREGTLGLLFLTDLRGHDVVLGKLSADAVRTFSLLFSVLPVFAMPLLLGGVTSGESWRVMSTLIVTLLFSLSIGLLFSAICTSNLAAMGGGFLLLTAVTLAPIALNWVFGASLFSAEFLWMTGPLGMFLASSDAAFRANGPAFWQAASLSLVLSVAMIVGATIAVRKVGWSASEGNQNSWWRRLLRPAAGAQKKCGDGLGQLDPGAWLAERTLPGRRVLWGVIGIGGVVCFLAGLLANDSAVWFVVLVQLGLGFLIKLWQAVIAPHSIHTARHSGALELLLCTPLTSRQIVDGQITAMSAYFVPAMLAVAIGLPLSVFAGAGIAQNETNMGLSSGMITFGIFWIVLFLLDLYALGYAGLWFGLTSPRVETAMAKTAFAVLLLPWLTMMVPLVGCLGLFFWPIFWIAWSSSKLNRQFRGKLAEQFTDGEGSWWPWKG